MSVHRMTLAILAAVVALSGCKRQPAPSGLPDLEQSVLLDRLADRPLPDTVRARFSVKLRSKPLGIAAPPLGGGLVVARPDRAYLAVLNPVGGPILTLATDGSRVLFLNHRDEQAFEEEDLSTTLGDKASGGVVMADLVDVLIGLLPVSADELVRTRRDQGYARMMFRRPDGTTITAWVDPGLGTPVRVEVEGSKGKPLVHAEYGPFEMTDDGPGLPTRVTLFVPNVELTVDLRYKTWSALDAPPDVFTPVVPERFSTLPMSAFSQGISAVADDVGEGGADGADTQETP